MSKWVRWWGLAAFAAVVGCVLLFWFVFADGLVQRLVERSGTALAGAQVDVREADVTFLPFGIALSGIAVTDPAAPGFNTIELGRVAFTVDGSNLLRRKVIIKELAAEGLRFNTPRQRPGAVVRPPERKASKDGGANGFLPSVKLPSAKEVLAKESLASLKVLDDASTELQKQREAWQMRLAKLPDKAALDAYRERVGKLRTAARSGGIAGAAGALSDARDLTRDIQKDLDAVKLARTAFAADLSASRTRADQALRAPQDDLRRITATYGLSASGLQNVSRMLFSGAVSSWIDRTALWYGRLKPLYDAAGTKQGNTTAVKPLRARGVDVRFREERPMPDLLISLVKASMQPAAGRFGGEVRNITPEQDVLGAPLTFSFSGAGLAELESLTVNGTLDHVRPAGARDTASIVIRGYRVSGLALSDSAAFPLVLQEGRADLSATASYDGQRITARLSAAVRAARFRTEGAAQGGVADALRAALEKVNAFTLAADITGTPDSYDVRITSDLDRVLKEAAGKMLGDRAAKFERELSAGIAELTGEKAKALQSGLGGMSALGGTFDSVETQLNGLLREASSGGGKTKLPF